MSQLSGAAVRFGRFAASSGPLRCRGGRPRRSSVHGPQRRRMCFRSVPARSGSPRHWLRRKCSQPPELRFLDQDMFWISRTNTQIRWQAGTAKIFECRFGKRFDPLPFGNIDLVDHLRYRRNEAADRAWDDLFAHRHEAYFAAFRPITGGDSIDGRHGTL